MLFPKNKLKKREKRNFLVEALKELNKLEPGHLQRQAYRLNILSGKYEYNLEYELKLSSNPRIFTQTDVLGKFATKKVRSPLNKEVPLIIS